MSFKHLARLPGSIFICTRGTSTKMQRLTFLKSAWKLFQSNSEKAIRRNYSHVSNCLSFSLFDLNIRVKEKGVEMATLKHPPATSLDLLLIVLYSSLI